VSARSAFEECTSAAQNAGLAASSALDQCQQAANQTVAALKSAN
jgi:hypothetical protein